MWVWAVRKMGAQGCGGSAVPWGGGKCRCLAASPFLPPVLWLFLPQPYLTGEQGKVRTRPALQSGRPGLPQHCSVWDLGVDELQRPPLSENSLIPLFCSQRNHKADVNGLARGSP